MLALEDIPSGTAVPVGGKLKRKRREHRSSGHIHVNEVAVDDSGLTEEMRLYTPSQINEQKCLARV